MANIALDSAASGLKALNTRLDVISNNLANVNTVGFKSSRANFQDLLYIERAQPGVENPDGGEKPTGLYVGLGVKVSGTQQNFETGSPIQTDQPYDLYIRGDGFFQVQVEDSLGEFAYTRAGNFTLNSEGVLVLATDIGRPLVPQIQIDPDAVSVSVSPDGRVMQVMPGNEIEEVGQIEIATFVNNAGLKPIGENLFVETEASGVPNNGAPQTERRGALLQGVLEASNVDPSRELIELIRTQRAFEMNSQTIRAADQALQTVSQLRR